jgi:hypothetical protein
MSASPRRAAAGLAGALALAAGTLGLVAGAPTAGGQAAAEPAPTPRAECGPASRPEPDMQGRVPAESVTSGDALEGYRCNLEMVGRHGNSAGYKVHRYIDAAGRECAYYDSTLLFPTGLATHENGPGVHVLDMTDPSKPVLTASLVTPAMQSPHESLTLHAGRGLLLADMGYPTTNPGFVDIYDVKADCRNPVLVHSSPLGILGHESGISPDGMTFWVTSTAARTITALDITNPAVPVPLWVGTDWFAHGVRISPDGNRLYSADAAGDKGVSILDVSEVQARVPNPTVTEISHLTWPEVSIPQVAIPITIAGRPYLAEIDEFGNGGPVGAARLIDIADEKNPKVVSNIRLEVNQTEAQAANAGDPGGDSSLSGYTGHYCNVPRADDPEILACSFTNSGLRVFDIRDPQAPREIAYFNQPVEGTFPGDPPVSYAMSAPTFVPERNEIWYADGNSGLWILRATNGVFGSAPAAGPTPAAAADVTPAPAAAAPAPRRTLPATGGSGALFGVGLALLGSALALRRRVTAAEDQEPRPPLRSGWKSR